MRRNLPRPIRLIRLLPTAPDPACALAHKRRHPRARRPAYPNARAAIRRHLAGRGATNAIPRDPKRRHPNARRATYPRARRPTHPHVANRSPRRRRLHPHNRRQTPRLRPARKRRRPLLGK